MIRWIALAAVLLALIGGVVWAATVNSGGWCAHDAMRGGCDGGAGDCPPAAGDAPVAGYGAPADRPRAAGGMHHGRH